MLCLEKIRGFEKILQNYKRLCRRIDRDSNSERDELTFPRAQRVKLQSMEIKLYNLRKFLQNKAGIFKLSFVHY